MTLAAGGALIVRYASKHAGILYDDAWIYFRYADNLFGGCALAYNCADGPIEGFTSPLYLALLALVAPLGIEWPAASRAIGAACLTLTFGAVVLLCARIRAGGEDERDAILVPAAAVGVLMLDEYVLVNAVTGLETALAAFVATWIFAAACREDMRGLRTLLVLGVLARPELALFALLLPILPRTRNLGYLAPLAAAGCGMLVIRWWLFGDFLPNTFWVKAGGTARHFELGLRYVGECLLDFPLVLASPLALLHRRLRSEVSWILAIAVAWLAFFLRSGGDFFDFSRLFFPLVPVLTVLAVSGLFAAVDAVGGERKWRGLAVGHLAVLAALAILGALVWKTHALRAFDVHPKHARWEQVGVWLGRHHPGARVATTPIGVIGYRSGAHIVDLAGLTSREIAHRGAVEPNFVNLGHERYHTDWVLSQRPDLIVTTYWSREPFAPGTVPNTQAVGEWDLVERIRRGAAPYVPYTPEVAPGVYWFMYRRAEAAAPGSRSGLPSGS